MIKLKIKHNKTFIVEHNPKELEQIKSKCKIIYSHWVGSNRVYEKTVNLFDGNELSFPTGYLNQLVEKLPSIDFEADDERNYKLYTVRINPTTFENNWESQNKFTEIIKQESEGLIVSPTGTGKSRFIEIMIDIKRVRTLVLAPTEEIRDSLTQNLSERYGTNNVQNKVIKFGKELVKLNKNSFHKRKGSIDINEDLNVGGMSAEEEYLYTKGYKKIGNSYKKVTRTHDAIEKESKKVTWPSIVVMCPNSIKNLPQEYLDSVEMLVVDEGHTAAQDTIREGSVLMSNLMYRYLISATIWKDRKEDMQVLLSVFGNKIIFEETYTEAVESNKVKKVQYKQENSPKPDEFLMDVTNPDDIVKRCIVGNAKRNTKIIEAAEEYISLGRKVMIAVTESAHCEVLRRRFEERGIEVYTYFSDQDKALKNEIKALSRDTKNKKPFVIISTIALGIGFDTKAVDTIILGDVRKASIGLLQRNGRGTRKVDFESEEILIINDFDDWFNKTTHKWSRERKKIIESYYFKNESFSRKMAKKHRLSVI